MLSIPKLIRSLLDPSTLWSVAEWVWPAGAAALSAGLSIIWQLPPSFTLAMATLTAVLVVVLVNEIRNASIFDKITFREIKPVHFLSTPNSVHMIQLGGQVENYHPNTPIFFNCEILNLVLQSKSNVDAEKLGENVSVPPNGGKQTVLLPAIEGIQDGEITGRLHVKIHYGRSLDHMPRAKEFKYKLTGAIFAPTVPHSAPGLSPRALTLNANLLETKST